MKHLWYVTWPWSIAGILSAMAWLTRSTGIVLVGIVGLALLFQLGWRIRHGRPVVSSLGLGLTQALAWTITSLVTTVALLPALWVAPGETLSKLWAWSSNAATEGHENPSFFKGIHYGNPGFDVYPTVLAWRTSPTEWLGVLLLIAFIWWGWKRGAVTPRMLTGILICVVFTLVYITAMSIGAKKFDRYILPVFPMITLLAAGGIHLAGRWIQSREWPLARKVAYSFIAILVVLQAGSWSTTLPYRLDYYNPLLGGGIRARNVLQMGWGQGGDQVVEYLETQPVNRPIIVQTSAVPSAFTYFLPDESNVRFRHFPIDTPAGWYETDFYVSGIQQSQRGLDPLAETLQAFDPVEVVAINGVPYFEVYNVQNLPLPSHLKQETACSGTFGSQFKLLQIVGRDESVDFYWLALDDLEAESQIRFSFTLNESEVGTYEVAVPERDSGLVFKTSIPFVGESPLANYTINIDSQSSTGGELPATASWIDGNAPHFTTHSECYYSPVPTSDGGE